MGNKNTIAIELVVNDNGSVTLKQFGDTAKKTFFDTKASTESAAKGMRDADTATRSLSESMGGMGSAIKSVVAAVGAYKIAEFAKDTALLAARYETMSVVMGVVGKNAGYSQERMDGFSLALQKNGISMVESRQGITKMAQANLDLSKATDLARVAQDAAVIGNTNSSEAFDRLIYGIQSAQPEILRTIGINVNFEESYRRVAKETGRTVESFSEAEKAQIRMNVVMEYGQTIAGTYEAAMTTAGKKITSFTRYVEDFKVKMGEAFSPATITLVDAATETMKKMQDEIQKPEAQKALRDLSTAIADVAVGIGTSLPGALVKTTNAISNLTSVYNSLPGELVGAAGAGIIGGVLFGSLGPAKGLAMLYLINEQFDKMPGNLSVNKALNNLDGLQDSIRNIQDVALGRKNWNTGRDINYFDMPTAAADTLKSMTIPSRGPSIANLAGLKAEIALFKAAHAGDRKPVDEKAIKDAQDNYLKGAELIAKLQEDTNKTTDEGMKFFTDQEEEKEKALEKEMDSWRKAGGIAVDEMEREISEGVKLTMAAIDRADKRREAERDLYTDLRGYETQYYAASIALIDAQAQKYRDLGVSKNAVDAWVAEEYQKAELKKLKTSDAFSAGAKAGYIELKRDQMTFGKAGYEIFNTYSKSSATALKTILFDSIKKGTFDTQAVWEGFSDSMLDKFTGTLSQMVVEAATQDIVMMFKSEWSAGGSNVLGIVNKVLGLASNIDWGFGGGDNAVPYHAKGGWIGGSALYPGNNIGNDTVPGWFSPGEYVVDRERIAAMGQHGDTMIAHINPAEAALLKALGGSGTINPRTGLPQFFDWGGILDPIGITSGGEHNIVTALAPAAKAVGNAIDYVMTEGMGSDLMKNISEQTPLLTRVVMSYIGGPPMVAALAAMESTAKGGNLKDAWISSSIAYLTAVAASYASGAAATDAGNSAQITSDMAGNAAYNAAIQQGASDAAAQAAYDAAYQQAMIEAGTQYMGKNVTDLMTSYAKKWIINQALGGGLSNTENGRMNLSYDGANDNGLLASLAGSMRDIAPRSDVFAFSAKNGLDYVPYDGFPIIAHKGERVQTAEEAEQSRQGMGGSADRLSGEVAALRQQVSDLEYTVGKHLSKLVGISERWDDNGLPPTRPS